MILIDGKKAAAELREELKKEVKAMKPVLESKDTTVPLKPLKRLQADQGSTS